MSKNGKKFWKRVNDFPTPYTVGAAIKNGGAMTKMSMLFMGAGNIAHKQIIKGLLFLLSEVAFITFLV